MLSPLTPKQKQILDYINLYWQANKIAPCLEEIKGHFHLKAISTVHEHIEKLKQKGYLRKEMNQARSMRITSATDRGEEIVEIDLLGNIAAGEPIEAIENAEPILVSKAILPKNNVPVFALRVKGNSMVEDGIFNDDLIVVQSQVTANNGDTVVAIVDKEFATLKKFYKEKDRIRLQPANSSMSPIYLRSVEIRGKLIALIRQY